MTQHDDMLRQRLLPPDQRRIIQLLTRARLQPGQGLRAVAALLGISAEIAQHGPRLHRGQLVLVPQKNQSCMQRQRIEQVGHHFQVDHRGFVHHQHVQRQRVARVVTEMTTVRQATQQAMQGRHRGRDLLLDGVIQRQRRDLTTDGLGQPCRSLAGRRRQAQAQRSTLGHRSLLQQGQQAHDSGRLASPWAAGDQGEASACGQGAGQLLPVGLTLTGHLQGFREQPGQALGQPLRLLRRGLQALADMCGDTLLVVPVAPQVQAGTPQHQWRRQLRRQQRAGPASIQPLLQAYRLQHLRWQRQPLFGLLALRRQRECEVRIVQGDRQVQAHVPLAQLMTGQRRGQQHERRSRFIQPGEELRQRTVQFAQPALLAPAGQHLEERLPRLQYRTHAGTSPASPTKSASSCSISARGGRARYCPLCGERRNR